VAAHRGLQSNVEKPKETRLGHSPGQELKEEIEFGEIRDVMGDKVIHRQSRKNNSGWTRGPMAIPPAKAQVPSCEHGATPMT
jgi:hypothetical protein